MQLTLLVQAHDMLQSAAITAIGPVDNIIELKNNLEIKLNNMMQFDTMRTGLLETQVPEKTRNVYPTVHVLIANQQKINNVAQQFHPNQMYNEVYNLVQNLALIENY